MGRGETKSPPWDIGTVVEFCSMMIWCQTSVMLAMWADMECHFEKEGLETSNR